MSADIPLIFAILLFVVAFNCLCVQSQKTLLRDKSASVTLIQRRQAIF